MVKENMEIRDCQSIKERLINEDYLLTQLESKLKRSVDVKLRQMFCCVLLSGGIDSSIITAMV